MTGWRDWAWTKTYWSEGVPGGAPLSPGSGANCQGYAYAIFELFGLPMPPLRSSELWSDPQFARPAVDSVRPLDLVLFKFGADSWGAHVAIYMANDEQLHLWKEIGYPARWSWPDFAGRPHYAHVVGLVPNAERYTVFASLSRALRIARTVVEISPIIESDTSLDFTLFVYAGARRFIESDEFRNSMRAPRRAAFALSEIMVSQ
jgi:cell wall-associated NlpC family hydrolase